MKKKLLIFLMMLLWLAPKAQAQCTFRNTAFKNGEFLTYNLYYNWKFVWVKAGTASWYVVNSTYKGTPAYRCSLTTKGNGRLDDYFVLRDTLLCYNTHQMAPLYFRKGAREGRRYTVDEVHYTYPNGKCAIRQYRKGSDGEVRRQSHVYNDCVYDMMSIFMRARSFNPEGWKKGFVVKFPIIDGNDCHPAQVLYKGKTTVKADNGHRYRCLALSYKEFEGGKWKEIARFYVTDDSNHVPVRLDMFLRFGSAKAFLVGMRGVRENITSLVK